MDYKVSVIVPVYNVAPYIERCAWSLFEQTMDDIQFIFVDDMSDDDSMARLESLLQYYPHRQPHTRLLRQSVHKGNSLTRKAGMELAEGEYVAFCDSDDFVEPTMYASLYRAAHQHDADMAECAFWHGNGHYDRRRYVRRQDVEGMLTGETWPYLWCRIARADLCRKVHFIETSYMEDWVIIAQLLHLCQRVAMVDEPLYHYCFNPESLTRTTTPAHLHRMMGDCMKSYQTLHDFICEHYPVGEDDFVWMKQNIRRKILPQLAASGNAEWRRYYLDTFPEINSHILCNCRMPRECKWEHLAVVLGLYPLMDKLREKVRAITAKRSGDSNRNALPSFNCR